MNFFKRLFRRNKNTIDMSADEAYRPSEEVQEPEAPVLIDEPQQPSPRQPQAKDNAAVLEGRVYAAMTQAEEAASVIRPAIREMFLSVNENQDGFDGILPSGFSAQIRIIRGADEVQQICASLKSTLESAPALNTDVRNACILQMSQFNVCFVLRVNGDPIAADDDLSLLTGQIASAVKGFSTRDDRRLFDRDDKLLMSNTGATEFTMFMPVKYCGDSCEETRQVSMSARAVRSREAMTAHGITDPVELTNEVSEDGIDLRPAEEIIRRAAALLCVALTAKAYTSPREIASPLTWCASLYRRFSDRYTVNTAFTPKEKLYLQSPSRDKHTSHLMRAEACGVLLWALGLCRLPWPDTPADLSEINNCLKDSDIRRLLSSIHPRSAGELADAYDLTVRLHALCVHSDLRAFSDTRLDPDILYERHYAFNWLLGVNGITEWDSIIPKV